MVSLKFVTPIHATEAPNVMNEIEKYRTNVKDRHDNVGISIKSQLCYNNQNLAPITER